MNCAAAKSHHLDPFVFEEQSGCLSWPSLAAFRGRLRLPFVAVYGCLSWPSLAASCARLWLPLAAVLRPSLARFRDRVVAVPVRLLELSCFRASPFFFFLLQLISRFCPVTPNLCPVKTPTLF
jgi:hypothetical protein